MISTTTWLILFAAFGVIVLAMTIFRSGPKKKVRLQVDDQTVRWAKGVEKDFRRRLAEPGDIHDEALLAVSKPHVKKALKILICHYMVEKDSLRARETRRQFQEIARFQQPGAGMAKVEAERKALAKELELYITRLPLPS